MEENYYGEKKYILIFCVGWMLVYSPYSLYSDS